MNLNRAVRITHHDIEDGVAVIPLNGIIIGIETCTDGGLEYQRHACGLWVEETLDAFDRETGASVYRDEMSGGDPFDNPPQPNP